ncbi:hypothetical protein KIN20_011087 [Parelaphostrongylus tenuis]|uniref:E3 ubiquitin-protein ligase n=1 Tax=Parelaphostrongylus tenuis TaxID=148309 RepID=A0AAD5MZU1_PARTN|nr:hypothetical protein KIN20_011087 [Parelaphostrongylus tenuis]
MDSASQRKSSSEGTGRATPDDIADANWEKCAEQIKTFLNNLPPGKVDLVMNAFHSRKSNISDDRHVTPSSTVECEDVKLENLPELAYVFNEDSANVITRMEWVDPMIASTLRLMSEIIVLLNNCGASAEAALRSEMVSSLASGPYTYSRLRSIIAEKGSRGAEFVDPLFDRVLNSIADFSDQWQYLVAKCARDPINSKLREREMLGNEEKIQQMWIPYQLSDFLIQPDMNRLRNIPKILLCDRFVQLCIVVLEAGILGRPEVRETTLQLVVYLVTLAYQYICTLPPGERHAAASRFRKSYLATEGLKVVQLPLLIFVLFLIECEKRGAKDKILKKTLAGDFDKKRIIGGAAEYMARLVTYISKCDDGVYLSLLSALDDCEKGKISEKKLDGNDQKAAQDRKAAAKRRRDALFAANKKKNSEDIDSIDTSQPDVRLYECPVCGELETPSTLRNPLGMLVRVAHNGLCENMIPSDEVEMSLLDLDSKAKHATPNFIRNWKTARNELFRRTLSFCDMIDLFTSVELKTCGHTVHIRCFNAYRETIRNDLRLGETRRSSREVSCFLCRFNVNALLPLRIDWGFETGHKEMLTETREKTFESLRDCIVNWRRIPQTSEDFAPYLRHFTENVNELIDAGYWNRWQELYNGGSEVQSQLVALIKSTVERSILLKKLKVPERRKGSRAAVTEHLIAACVCRTTRQNEEVSLAAAQDLLLPKFGQEHLPLLVEEELTFSDDDLINISDIRRDDLIALQSTSARERLRRHSLTEGPGSAKTNYLDKPASVPLLMFCMKSLLVRLSAFVLDSHHLSAEDKRSEFLKESCVHVLACRVMAALAVKTILRLLLRSSLSTLNSVSSGTYPGEDFPKPFANVPRMIWSRLSSNTAYLDSLLEVMHHDGWQEEKSFGPAFEWTLTDFTLFVAEFWQQLGLSKVSAFDYNSVTLNDALNAIGLDQLSVVPEQECIDSWIRHFSPFVIWNYSTPRKAFSMEPLTWRPFLLLELPHEYDVLFARYFQRPCLSCGKVPQFPFVCLLCSKLVCLDSCCNTASVAGHEGSLSTNEVERHALDCGREACLFLALNSSLIVIVRVSLAAIWGSVYLDTHGEEDRNLRRGKPLFLSSKRVECLRCDWAEQEWEMAGVAWMTIDSMQQQLKDAHLYR